MNPLNPIPDIWLKLAGALAVILLGVAIFIAGDVHGDRAGADRVQVAWDKADKVAQQVRAARIAAANAVTKALQDKADADRKKHAEEDARRDARLSAALGELRNRPERPAPGPAGDPKPAGAGPAPVCTGAGLYRDDAEFLVRFADRAQRIREQRDQYFLEYGRAREELERLKGAKP